MYVCMSKQYQHNKNQSAPALQFRPSARTLQSTVPWLQLRNPRVRCSARGRQSCLVIRPSNKCRETPQTFAQLPPEFQQTCCSGNREVRCRCHSHVLGGKWDAQLERSIAVAVRVQKVLRSPRKIRYRIGHCLLFEFEILVLSLHRDRLN